MDGRFNRIDVTLADIEHRLRLLQWEVGGMAVLLLPSLWLLLRVAAKVGALG